MKKIIAALTIIIIIAIIVICAVVLSTCSYADFKAIFGGGGGYVPTAVRLDKVSIIF